MSFLTLVPGGYVAAQVAGTTRLGVTVEQTNAVALGWSAKKQFLGQNIYDEENQRVGKIHDVAVPVTQLTLQDGKFTLAGATKD